MLKAIQTPRISEILIEEFMKPMNLSSYKLAHDIDVPVSRIQDILHDRRKISVDTSIRLGKYFGVSERYFIDMQIDIDTRDAWLKMAESYDRITPLITSSKIL